MKDTDCQSTEIILITFMTLTGGFNIVAEMILNLIKI